MNSQNTSDVTSRLFAHVLQDIARYQTSPGASWWMDAARACYSHPAFLGILYYRLGRFLWQRRNNWMWRVMYGLSRVGYPLVRMYSGLELAATADIGPGLWIGHMGPTVIHPATRAGSHLTLLHGVTIGAAASGVPVLGNEVSIGVGATVIGSIRVGDGVTVGAGAVVTRDVPPNTLVVGIPAKPIGVRSGIEGMDEQVTQREILGM